MQSIQNKKINDYEKSLNIMKNNINRIIAVTLFLISLIVLLILIWLFTDYVLYYIFKSINFSGNFADIISNCIKTTITLIPTIFLFFPLSLGVDKWFYLIGNSKMNNIPLNVLFFYFKDKKNYFRALNIKIELLFAKILIYIIALIPAFVLDTFQKFIFGQIVTFKILGVLEFIFFVAGIVVGFFYNNKYFMVKYLFFTNESTKVSKILFDSECIMRTRKKDIIKMYLSFMPFYILSILIVPILFLFPYMILYFNQKSKEFIGKSVNCK